MQFCVSV